MLYSGYAVRDLRVTAVFNSIDRSTENRTPNRCLPFGGIGALFSVERSIELTTAVKHANRADFSTINIFVKILMASRSLRDTTSDPMRWYRGTNNDTTISNYGGHRISVSTGYIMLCEILTTIPFGDAVHGGKRGYCFSVPERHTPVYSFQYFGVPRTYSKAVHYMILR